MQASCVDQKAPPFLFHSRTRAAEEDRGYVARSAGTRARASTELRTVRRAGDPAKRSAEPGAELSRRSPSPRTCNRGLRSTSPPLPADIDGGDRAERVSLRATIVARRRRDCGVRIAPGQSGALRSHGAALRPDRPARPTRMRADAPR